MQLKHNLVVLLLVTFICKLVLIDTAKGVSFKTKRTPSSAKVHFDQGIR